MQRREDETHSGPFSGMPWQVKALGIFGAPTLIACYLVWLLGSTVSGQVGATQQMLVEHVAQMSQLTITQQQLAGQNETIIRVLRTNCVNNAKDNESRERCLR